MSILIIASAIFIGLLLIIYVVRIHLKYSKPQEFALFGLTNEPHEVNLLKGEYSIDIIGGGNVKKLPLKITRSTDGKGVTLYIQNLKYRYFRKGILAITYFYFKIDTAGSYRFSIKDLEQVNLTHFTPGLLSILSSSINTSSLKLLIKPYSSPLAYIISLIIGLVAITLLMFGIVAVLSKTGVIPPLPIHI